MRVIALGGQCGTLVDAEAVLLVGDDETEVLVLYVGREQGVRADDEESSPDRRRSFSARRSLALVEAVSSAQGVPRGSKSGASEQ